MYPGQVRSQDYVIQSFTQTNQPLTVTCEGAFCKYVTLSRSSVNLAGMATSDVVAKLSMPNTALYNDNYQFTVKIGDASGHTAVLTNAISVSKLSAWYSKFSPFVQAGDVGFWFALGSFAVPKIILYVLLVIAAELITFFSFPGGGKNKENLTLALLISGVGVFLLSSVFI